MILRTAINKNYIDDYGAIIPDVKAAVKDMFPLEEFDELKEIA
jgi:hypothetical protein